jgi:Mg2+/Co2+ transporter CorC
MKQLIKEAKRMQQLAGIIKEFGDVSPYDFQIEKVMELVQDAIDEYPNEDDRDKLVHAFERTTLPEANIFTIADDLIAGKITAEDIKTIVQNIASKLGSVNENEMQGADWNALEVAIKSAMDAEGGGPEVVDQIKHIVDTIAAGGSINDPELAN